MGRLNRRDFLKALGLGGTVSAVSACGLDDNRYYTPVEQLLPYVVKPEQVVPGTPTFFATTITSGPQAWPVLARHRDGRVINVGANPRAPWPGAVAKGALLELQRHYSPDRIKAPRAGAAGDELTWDAAVGQLAAAVQQARAGGGTVAYLGPYRSGAMVQLLDEYTDGNAVFWEPLGRETEAGAAEALWGSRALPRYDLSKAHYILSFGADFLGWWGGTQLATQYAAARNPNVDHFVARFALVAPHMDQTGANADDWFAVVPGTEAAVALAVAKLVAAKKGYQGPLSGMLSGVDEAAAAQAAGIEPATLDAIASQFASAKAAVALPGGTAGASEVATDLAVASYVLNLVAGNTAETFLPGGYAGPIDGYARIEELVGAMDAGKIAVLLVDDVNPIYALPAGSRFAEALAKVGLTVAVSSHPDETVAAAGLILPTSDAFEDWGHEEPQQGLHLLRQPAQSPLHDTRSLGDILLATARAAGVGAAAAPAEGEAAEAAEGEAEGAEAATGAATRVGFAAESWRAYIRSYLQQRVFPAAMAGTAGASFGRWFEEKLADGFILADRGQGSFPAPRGDYRPAPVPTFSGEGYFLHAYPHPHRYDGRFANQPWAQEVGDPVTGHVWDSWVEIHPTTARDLGVEDKDLVEIQTEHGKIRVGVEIYPGIRADTIAVAFGQGHEAAGRYADSVGENVARLLGVVKDAAGGLAWQQTRAKVTRMGVVSGVVSIIGGDDDLGRSFGVVVDAEALAEHGDDPSDHPGDLTGIHHLPLEERLVERGQTDFYPLPDHPVYRFGMTVDTNACTGCGTCVIACYAENNLPVVGKELVRKGREMNWIRINRYYEEEEHGGLGVRFVPMLCQHCGHAPCENVCPVLATYHTIDGLNAMVYNRCVGTRYCANNCPYVVRRFNFHTYVWPEPFNLQLNPDVTVREMGVMEKCTFCVQRIRQVRSAYRDQGFDKVVPSEAMEQLPACAEACPTQALTFGNLLEPESKVAKARLSARSYRALEEVNTKPAVNYLARASFHMPADAHGGGHGAPATGHHAEPGDEAGKHGGNDHTEPAPHAGGH